MSLRLQITYGRQETIAEQGGITVDHALQLFAQLVDLPVQVIFASEEHARIIVTCGTHLVVPGLDHRHPPADWEGLAYMFSTPSGRPDGSFQQLYNAVLSLATRRIELFGVGARIAMSRALSPPAVMLQHHWPGSG